MPDRGSEATFSVPESLLWLKQIDGGTAWLASLPGLIAASCSRFDLKLSGPPFSGGCVSLVLPVRRGGKDAVLKLQFIDRESRHEADALKAWAGRGAIRLLDQAEDIGALLLERCRPAHFLADDPSADKLGVMADLLRRLLIPTGAPFTSLRDEAAIWIDTMETNWQKAGRPCEKRLVDAAVGALSDLSRGETDSSTLLHQDLHGHNVLSAEREAWLAIDPKPLAGDPAFALSPIVRSFEFGHSKDAVLHRLDRLSEELGLDRERARLWTIGQTMAWGFSGDYCARHHETVRWLLGA